MANVCMLSCVNHVRLFVTPWTVARQAPLSVGFPRQEYWSGLPFPSPDLCVNESKFTFMLNAWVNSIFVEYNAVWTGFSKSHGSDLS